MRAFATVTSTLVAFGTACSSPPPDATLRSSAPSPPTIAAGLPDPRCPGAPGEFPADVNEEGEDSGPTIVVPVFDLPCENAVDAALLSLPDDHAPIASIDFRYGDYCPPGVFCPVSDWTRGYVVFYVSGDGDDIWVRVRGSRGHVRVIGDPEPFPPSSRAGTNG